MKLRTFLPTLLVTFTIASAQAVPLPQGAVLYPAPAEPDPIGGNLVFTTGPIPFTALTFTGDLTSTVFNQDPLNPFGANALTFVYQLNNFQISQDSVVRLTVSRFDSFLVDASFQPSAGVNPTLIDRSGNGDVIGFQFLMPALMPGASSARLVLQTSAVNYSPSLASIIDGSVAIAATIAPVPVPEPSSLAVAGVGLLVGLSLWGRGRR
jgi:hypothetical protein